MTKEALKSRKGRLVYQIPIFLSFAAFIVVFYYFTGVKSAESVAFRDYPDFSQKGRSLQSQSLECIEEYPEFCVSVPTDCELILPHTCCKVEEEREICITEFDDKTCLREDVCAAELIPGGSGAGECFAPWERERAVGIIIYIFIILYLFLGLAIICDDYFVPSLEKISSSLELSEDVAGATFMAAGSSAPELFVSLADNVFANPPKNLGTGTIVGSAIFNILVIIGLSAVLARQDLHLDWRPLARDSAFYILSILLLVGAVADEKVEFWEGLVLFCVYGGYVLFMRYNSLFFGFLERLLRKSEKKSEEEDTSTTDSNDKKEEKPSESNDIELALKESSPTPDPKPSQPVSSEEMKENIKMRHTFDAKSLSKKEEKPQRRASMSEIAVRPKFNRLSRQTSINPIHLSKYRAHWKITGQDSFTQFNKEERSLQKQDSFATVAKKVIAIKRIERVWLQKVREREAEGTLKEKEEEEEEEEEEEDDYWEVLRWPVLPKNAVVPGSPTAKPNRSFLLRAVSDWDIMWKARALYFFTFPLNLLLRFTIPDCNFDVFNEDKNDKEENRKLGFSVAFFMCILWIGVLSHLLVYCATLFGCLVGISPTIMGLTLLAAGTSVPDALSSVIVAKSGKGDMAVANSIGSNVFDILIGLGLPWFIAGLAFERPVAVDNTDLWYGLFFLFAVVIFLVLLLVAKKWVLNYKIGITLLVFYGIYIIFELFIKPVF